MEYSQEHIYRIVGKDNNVAALTLKTDSESYKKYGGEPTVVFLYTQRERDELDKQITTNACTHGMAKVKVLFYNLSTIGLKSELPEEIEINSQDIEDIYYLPFNLNQNTFHSTEKRTINKIQIETQALAEGGDWDWFYNFEKMRVMENGIILSPEEHKRYLALKLFYEPSDLTEEEKNEIFVTEKDLNENVGFYYFKILEDKGLKVDDNVIENLKKLFFKRMNEKGELLNKYLIEAGSSLKKLVKENPGMVTTLFMKLIEFRQERLNVMGRYPIYMDEDSYLHIITRHVEDFKFNTHYEKKDNFQWFEEDVIIVMRKVIEKIDEEYQEFRTLKPTSRYSRYKDDSIYFEGDYYTLRIQPSGRIDTLYKNRKNNNNRK